MWFFKSNILASFQSSPPPFCPEGRSTDIDAIIDIISRAERFIYISVMDYFPLQIYIPERR
jgi:phospholipase D3/4